MIFNPRGQGSVETLFGLIAMVLLGTGLVLILYRSLVFHFADYQAHEALICTQSETTSFCQRELETRIKKILFAGGDCQTQLRRSYSGASKVSLKIQIYSEIKALSVPIEIEKTLSGI